MENIPQSREAFEAVADAFQREGYTRRADQIRRCASWRVGGSDHPCGLRACPRCGRIRADKRRKSILAFLRETPLPGVAPRAFGRLSSFGATARGAWAKLRRTWDRFLARARRRGWVVVGGRHPDRGDGGRWHPHVHLLVYGEGEVSVSAIRQAWERAGGDGAWAVSLDVPPAAGLTPEEFLHHRADDDLTGFVRYMVDGAEDGAVDLDPRDVVSWDRATRGARLVFRPHRARDPEKRNVTTVTVRDLDGIADRVVEMVRATPRTMGELQRGLTPRRRAHLVEVVDALTKDGRIAVVRGIGRAMRWAMPEPQGRRRRHPKLAA